MLTVLLIILIILVLLLVEFAYQGNLDPAPKPDYAKINRMEYELGIQQSNYRAFGIEPIDAAPVIKATNQVMREIDRALDPLADAEMTIVAHYSVPTHIMGGLPPSSIPPPPVPGCGYVGRSWNDGCT